MDARRLVSVRAGSFSLRLHLGALGLAALTLGGCRSGHRDGAAAAASGVGPATVATAAGLIEESSVVPIATDGHANG